jgi:hypothetical protein
MKSINIFVQSDLIIILVNLTTTFRRIKAKVTFLMHIFGIESHDHSIEIRETQQFFL